MPTNENVAKAVRERTLISFYPLAEEINDSAELMAIYAAPAWAELSSDGREWVAGLVRECCALSAGIVSGDTINQRRYVPGVFRCPPCKFRLIKSSLNRFDGTVTAADSPGDHCPNCHSPLWRVSWEDESAEAYTVAENQMLRALAAEERIRDLERLLERHKPIDWKA